MRLAALVLALVVLAGCQGAHRAPAPTENTLSPLPPPRNVHPDDLIGLDALQEPGVGNSSRLTWRQECIRQWTSGAYTFSNPPLVQGSPCRFLPTKDGTLHFLPISSSAPAGRYAAASAALARDDGYFDWVFVLPGTRDLYYAENGSWTPRLVKKDLPTSLDPLQPEQRISAVRIPGGSVHVLVYDPGLARNLTSAAPDGPKIHHVWWQEGAEAKMETVEGGLWYKLPILRTNGNVVVAFAPIEPFAGASNLYVSTGGAFTTVPLPAVLYDLWAGPEMVYGCVGTGAAVQLLELRFTAGAPIITFDTVGINPLAAALFYCEVTLTKAGPMLVLDSLVGHQALEHDVAAVREGLTWSYHLIPARADYGAQDLTSSHGVPYYTFINGNATGSNAWTIGSPVLAPDGGDPSKPWKMTWGNYAADDQWFLDVPSREEILITSPGWLNPPFRYPWFGFEAGWVPSWGVVELPPTQTI